MIYKKWLFSRRFLSVSKISCLILAVRNSQGDTHFETDTSVDRSIRIWIKSGGLM